MLLVDMSDVESYSVVGHVGFQVGADLRNFSREQISQAEQNKTFN